MSEQNALVAGRYTLDDLIGRGGMGDVYRGTDTRTNTPVAIKLLHEAIVAENPHIVDRFVREGEMLRQLNHPNIVTVLDAVQERGRHYLVMEYVSGGSLRDLIDEQSRLPIEAVLNVALDLSDALARAHRLSIIHRDIKPDNVLLAEDGTPRLTDFGVAHMGDRTRLTQTGSVIGTYAYLSPEACNGLDLDERTDIWSFGVMLFEMLTGRVPFNELSTAAMLTAILHKPAPDLSRLRPETPPALVDLISRMLEKNRANRVPSVRVVGAEIEAIIRTLDTPLRNRVLEAGHLPTVGTRFGELPDAEFSPVPAMMRSTPQQTHGYSLFPPARRPAERPSMYTPGGTPLSTAEMVQAQARANTRKWQLIALMVIVTVLACSTVSIFALIYGPGGESPPGSPQTDLGVIEPVEPGAFMVLVSELESLGSAPRPVARQIASDLQQTIEEGIAFSLVRVRTTPAVITSEEQARAAAEQAGATVIIWGSYSDDWIELQVQAGVFDAFPHIPFDRAVIDRAANVRVRLTDERRESVAAQVAGVLDVMAVADGSQFGWMLATVVLDTLEIVPPEVLGNTAAAYTHRALQHYGGDPAEVIAALEEAIGRDSGNAILYMLRGLARLRSGDFSAAVLDFATAQRLGPPDWAMPLYMKETPTVDAAIANYRELIALRPDDWFAYFLLGMTLYEEHDDLEAARLALEQSIASRPRANLPFVPAMLIALRQGRIADAQDYARTILAAYPDPELTNRAMLAVYGPGQVGEFTGVYFSAATNLVLGQYAQVYDAITRAFEMASQVEAGPDPMREGTHGLSDLYFMQGVAACNLQDQAAALKAYTRALMASPDFVLAYLLRAQIFALRDEPENAARDLATVKRYSRTEEHARWIAAAEAGAFTCATLFEYHPE